MTDKEKIVYDILCSEEQPPEGQHWEGFVASKIAAALAQPEPEPVAWMRADKGHIGFHKVAPSGYVPLYTAPPKKEWVGLTDVEMLVAAFQAGFDVHEDFDNEDDPDTLHWWSEDGEPCDDTLHKLRNIIEAKLKDKNI